MDLLRKQIKDALKDNEDVEVFLLQPGVMYIKKDIPLMRNGKPQWFTVVDFMNEFKNRPVHFYSNLVPQKKVYCKFTYTNDMFFAGYKLYIKNQRCAGLLKELDSIQQKYQEHTGGTRVIRPWELLLGETNDNKDLLHDMVNAHNVKNKVFLTYFGRDPDKGSWSSYVEKPKEHTAETLGGPSTRNKIQIRCSDLFDPIIYNQTFYTAAIETVVHKDFAMFSEKEAKPIVAKRPFVVFGSPGHMKSFRSLGFKSFASVIDESYDNIEDKEERWNRVLDSMQELSRQNPVQVYKELKSVLEYNKKHFETKKWKRSFKFNFYQ